MKRVLLAFFAALLVLCNFAIADGAQAQPWMGLAASANASVQDDLIEQLKTQVLPQIDDILTSEQQDELEAAVGEGKVSLRKAFKSLSLTPTQKTKLAVVFKSLPKKEIFTTMTPDQKKSFFAKKKELFTPTPKEIAEYKTPSGK
ncbi:hypothetical protein [Myxacorys almedinensis]|uniref:Uncharacterized protein n=1 Tax=Myxacorys almedinensis A TaxID=2690445 RepID=A0A8J8CI34_9CYAN|nr:hypothetical protein [Myxacorys almedinensis]NDJ17343.1 hypothetical protein [Myxacorys almedinensis A]